MGAVTFEDVRARRVKQVRRICEGNIKAAELLARVQSLISKPNVDVDKIGWSLMVGELEDRLAESRFKIEKKVVVWGEAKDRQPKCAADRICQRECKKRTRSKCKFKESAEPRWEIGEILSWLMMVASSVRGGVVLGR